MILFNFKDAREIIFPPSPLLSPLQYNLHWPRINLIYFFNQGVQKCITVFIVCSIILIYLVRGGDIYESR